MMLDLFGHDLVKSLQPTVGRVVASPSSQIGRALDVGEENRC